MRWPALVVAVITLALAIPHLDLLFVEASYPTSFYTSPTEFAATAIVLGEMVVRRELHCLSWHGRAWRRTLRQIAPRGRQLI